VNQQGQRSSNSKIEELDPYHGERTKLRPFLSHCELKFRTEPNTFDTDERKVTYTGSLLKVVVWNWVEPLITAENAPVMIWAEFTTAIG
jgi:hypothetical protein